MARDRRERETLTIRIYANEEEEEDERKGTKKKNKDDYKQTIQMVISRMYIIQFGSEQCNYV